TIRALTKLEFAYGLATRMAELIGDYSPATTEMLGELACYVRLTANAVELSLEQAAEHGADGATADERAQVFRLAWDFVGSALGGRGFLYERFYLTSASRNKQMLHTRFFDRTRSQALLKDMLSRGRRAD